MRFAPVSLVTLVFGCGTSIDAWLADQFSLELMQLARDQPDTTLNGVYKYVYQRVPGSHVSIYNPFNFGDAEKISYAEFLHP